MRTNPLPNTTKWTVGQLKDLELAPCRLCGSRAAIGRRDADTVMLYCTNERCGIQMPRKIFTRKFLTPAQSAYSRKHGFQAFVDRMAEEAYRALAPRWNRDHNRVWEALTILVKAKVIKEEKGDTPEYRRLKNAGWRRAKTLVLPHE